MYDFRTTRIYYSDLSVQLGDYTATLDYAGCDEPWAWNTVRHSHTNYELHIISRGKGTLVTDEGKFEINGGTIYLTGPGVYHSQYSGADDPMDECALRFNLEPRPQQSSDRELTALIKKLVDEDELKRIIDEREGDISVWELSEWFDVTEKFMMKAVKFYFGDK